MIPGAGTRAAALPAGVIDVWRIALTPPGVPWSQLHDTLDDGERAHAARLGANADAWVASHGALRMILGGYLNVAAHTLRFTVDALGKPRLAEQRRVLEFSLSHSDSLALLAVASDRAVGADLERVRDDVDVEAVTREFLSPGDAAAMSVAPAEQRRAAFFAAWTRREARLKLYGQPLDSVATEPPLPAGGLVVTRALDVAPGFAAAIAAEGSGWRIRIRDFPEGPSSRE